VLSCEHGGNSIPPEYAHFFAGGRARRALDSHRGHDIGALHIARELARRFGVPLISSEVSRLLVDLNRSVGHPGHFSQFVSSLGESERQALLSKYYFPHRQQVEQEVARRLRHGVLHVAVHSFTPRLGGEVRRADIGLLYDPASAGERQLCERWKRTLNQVAPELLVRRNYPYLGKADGLATHFRRKFGHAAYLGVELETNQEKLATSPQLLDATLQTLSNSLAQLLVL
jgi:predicted N-formylglutamate amidohydrolase